MPDPLTNNFLGCLAMLTSEQDPTVFSYWVAANLPAEDDVRQRLLSAPSTVDRLQTLLQIVGSNDTALCCFNCSQMIARTNNIVTISTEVWSAYSDDNMRAYRNIFATDQALRNGHVFPFPGRRQCLRQSTWLCTSNGDCEKRGISSNSCNWCSHID